MKYLAAYCLLVLGGKASPSESDVAKPLKDTGVEADTEELKVMLKRVTAEGKSIPELIADGRG